MKRMHRELPSGLGLPWWLGSKESACSAGNMGSVPGSGRSPGGGNGNPLTVFLLGKSHGQRSLVGYSPWGCKPSDMTFAAMAQVQSLVEEDTASYVVWPKQKTNKQIYVYVYLNHFVIQQKLSHGKLTILQ